MNSRERVDLTLKFQRADRVPIQLWLTPEVSQTMQKHFNVDTEEDLMDTLDVDVRWLLVDYVGPELKTYADGSKDNVFGMRFKRVQNQFGCYEEFSFHPLAHAQTVEDVENYRWPDPDWWDYSSIEKAIEVANCVEPRWLGIGYASLFERSWGLMGFEKLLYDMATTPEIIESVFDHLFNFYLEQTSHILDAANGRVDMVYIADDLGSQKGLLISPNMFNQYLKCRWKSFIDAIKERFGSQLKFQFHSCGAVLKLVDEFIAMGVDILNPIQPKAAGMDPQVLKDHFGSKLCFCGGLDIQDLLPNGTKQDVYNEATRLVHILNNSGGYIASPAHAVQPDTPLDNILAMLDGFKDTYAV